MNTLTITRGLPGSGKSTWSLFHAEKTGALIIGRDFIRLQVLKLHSTLGTKEEETLVTQMQRQMVQEALLHGYNVIVDDTNLPQRRAKDWADLAQRCRSQFRVQDFSHVPLSVCLERNEKRNPSVKYVKPDVIRKMHHRFFASGNYDPYVKARKEDTTPEKYEKDASLPSAYIFDIDGTLAKMTTRSPYEWNKVGDDLCNEWVADLLMILKSLGDYKIVLLSGRDSAARDATIRWCFDHDIEFDKLVMRKQGDHRKDSIIKAELFWSEVAPFYSVQAVFDDRQQVVDMWRKMGVPCAQVDYGAF